MKSSSKGKGKSTEDEVKDATTGVENVKLEAKADVVATNKAVLEQPVTAKVVNDNAPVEKDVGVKGTPIPVSNAVDNVVAPSVILEKAPPNPTVSAEVTTTPMALERIGIDSKIPTTDRFHSRLIMKKTPDLERFYFESTYVLGSFKSPQEFHVRRMEEAFKLWDHYRKVIVGVPKILHPYISLQNRITKPENAGLPLTTWIDDLKNEERAPRMSLVYQMSDNMTIGQEEGDRTKETQLFFGLPQEAAMYHWFQNENESHLMNPMEMWEFMKQMDTRYSMLVPMKPEQRDYEWYKMWFDQPTGAYNLMMDRSPQLRRGILLPLKKLIDGKIPIPIEQETMAFKELLNVLNVNTQSFDFKNEVASSLSSGKARDLVAKLITVLCTSRWSAIEYMVDFSPRNLIPAIVECVLAKLFIPYQCITEASRRDIDNFLAMYLVAELPGYNKQLFPRPSELDCRHASTNGVDGVNYLTEMLDTANVVTGLAAIKPFLYTGHDGSGWNTTEAVNPVLFHDSSSKFVNNRDIRFVPLTGTMADDPETKFEQFDRFKSFMSVLSTVGTKGRGSRAALSAAFVVLDNLMNKEARTCALMYYINRVVSKLGMASCMYPAHPNERGTDNNKPNRKYECTFPIETNSIISALYLVDFEKIDDMNVTVDFLETGWTINHYFTNLTEVFQLVQANYLKPWFTASDKMNLIKQHMTANFSLSGIVHEMWGAYPNLWDMMDTIIPRDGEIDMTKRQVYAGVTKCLDFIDENLDLYGIVPHFYYDPRVDRDADVVTIEFFKRHHVEEIPDEEVQHEYDWRSLQMALQVNTLRDTMHTARVSGKVVKFNFPVQVRSIESPGVEIDKQPMPFDFFVGRNFLEIRDLVSYYYWNDKFLFEQDNDLIGVQPPVWIANIAYPFIFRNKIDFQQLMGHVFRVWKDNFKLVQDFEFRNKLN